MKLSFITFLLSLIMISGNAQNNDSSCKDNPSATHCRGNKDHERQMRGGKKTHRPHGHGGHRHHKNSHHHHHSH